MAEKDEVSAYCLMGFKNAPLSVELMPCFYDHLDKNFTTHRNGDCLAVVVSYPGDERRGRGGLKGAVNVISREKVKEVISTLQGFLDGNWAGAGVRKLPHLDLDVDVKL